MIVKFDEIAEFAVEHSPKADRNTYFAVDSVTNPTVIISAACIQAMMTYCVRITNVSDNVLPVLIELTSFMKTLKYYKFWIVKPEELLNTYRLPGYTWYDEDLILKGQQSRIAASNLNRTVNYERDEVVRMFVLKQPDRIQIFREMNFADYKGTENKHYE